MNFPFFVVSTRPAVSSSLMWCERVAGVMSCDPASRLRLFPAPRVEIAGGRARLGSD